MIPAHFADRRLHRRIDLPRMRMRPMRAIRQIGQALLPIPAQPTVNCLARFAFFVVDMSIVL
jgi:hypothetical protein